MDVKILYINFDDHLEAQNERLVFSNIVRAPFIIKQHISLWKDKEYSCPNTSLCELGLRTSSMEESFQ